MIDLPVFVSASNYRLFIHEDDAKTASSTVDPGRGVKWACVYVEGGRNGQQMRGRLAKTHTDTTTQTLICTDYTTHTYTSSTYELVSNQLLARPDGPSGLEK